MTYASFCCYPKNNKPISYWAYSFANRIDLFFEVGVSRVIHFERGLDLGALGINSSVYTVELSFEARDEYIVKKLVFLK